MKRVLKIIGFVLSGLLIAVAGFAVYAAMSGPPTYPAPTPTVAALQATPERLELGEKLVLANCADCHLNRATGSLTGHRLTEVPAAFGSLYSANITQDATHGIGQWTDAELVGLLRTGVGREGRLRVAMPSFVHMADEDINSIVTFLRSGSALVAPQAIPSQPQEPSWLMKVLVKATAKPTPLPTAPIVAPAATNAVAFGRYLVVGRYKCYDCHSKDFNTNHELEPEKSVGYLGGGNQMANLQGQPVQSRNITADAETGIGDWTEGQLADALRFGRSPNGPLGAPMPKYSRMTDAEVHALYTYLRTVPTLRNATAEDGAPAPQ